LRDEHDEDKSWDGTLAPLPIKFLIYLRQKPQGAGFFEVFQNKPYPFNWDYMMFGAYHISNYVIDPFYLHSPGGQPFAKGLAYQIAASGKRIALVAPLPSMEKQHGSFKEDVSFVEELLEEISGHISRRLGHYFSTVRHGRVAMATVSAGHTDLAEFLSKHIDKPFCRDVLSELYFCDPRNGDGAVAEANVNLARTWASRGSAVKMIRLYNSAFSGGHTKLVGNVPAEPFCITSGNHTASACANGVWEDAGHRAAISQSRFKQLGRPTPVTVAGVRQIKDARMDYGHHAHGNMMIAHALHQSWLM
jgi:hypothetical protein